jgi:hypothetical protein
MKLKTLLVINAILLGFFGLTQTLIPAATAATYGATLDPVAKHNLQTLGAYYLGLAVLSWMARKVTDSNALRAILLAFFISYSIAMIIGIIDLLAIPFNALAWSNILLYLLLLIGFGYYLFVKPSAALPDEQLS